MSNSEEIPSPNLQTSPGLKSSPVKSTEEEQSIPPEISSQRNQVTEPQPKVVTISQKRVVNNAPQPVQQAPEEPVSIQAAENTVLPVSVKEEAEAAVSEQPAVAVKAEDVALTSSSYEEEVNGKSDHSIWDGLLQKYVTGTGKVNYAGLKSESSKIQSYLDQLAANPIESDWTRSEKMAYWINAYNAFTIKLILDNYPTSSITKLHGGKPWDVKWIKLGGKTYSLNQIENDILRPQFKDARIHFAVNCAAKSCPPLLNRAWTGANLNSFLNKQTKAFINNSKYNTVNAKRLNISKIFEWYAGDFGNLIEFLNKYSETSISKNAAITYQEYDWALNN